MWTQIEEVLLTAVSVPTQIIVSDPNDLIEAGNWVIIRPMDKECEIRKVDTISGTSTRTITFETGKDLVFSHAIATAVYVQTSPNWDVLLFGANIPNMFLNQSVINMYAFNAAVADCTINGGGIISIPKGEYLLSPSGTGSGDSCIVLNALSNIKFVGEGIDVSIIRISDVAFVSTVHIFECLSCSGIEWYDLTIDGNRTIIPSGLDHNIIESIDCNSLHIERVNFINSYQDCIRGRNINRMIVKSCNLTFSGRYGIHLNADTSDVVITDCFFADNDAEDIYCFADGTSITNLIVSNNIIERTASTTSKYALYLKAKAAARYS
ncbi:MAG: hypothetical protein EOO89_31045, partial [Pedobacter sp.]